MAAVANSTPLIALSKIGLFELLKDYFNEILIPEEVYEEVKQCLATGEMALA